MYGVCVLSKGTSCLVNDFELIETHSGIHGACVPVLSIGQWPYYL